MVARYRTPLKNRLLQGHKASMALFGKKSEEPVVSKESQKLMKELQDQIAQELAVANATELVSKISENCFAKCIPSPGPQMTAAEDNCINQCQEKYMRAWNVISKAYITRIQQSK